MDNTGISLINIFRRFRLKISFTMFMALVESVIMLLFPLFIGLAINDLLSSKNAGLINLGFLGFSSLIASAARRFFDTRAYAQIYVEITSELVEKERIQEVSISKTNARVGLINEFVQFFENEFPKILSGFIEILGTLFILFFIDKSIFLGCLLVIAFIIFVYGFTSKYYTSYNKGFNDDLENQLDCISNPKYNVKKYFKNIMKWNINLSDLETINFSLIWLLMIGLLLYSVKTTTENSLEYGTIFSIILYVFQFIENAFTLPFYYQQLIRLKEISTRLKG